MWLAPGERFFPSSTLDFLENTKPSQSFGARGKLPVGAKSWHTYLEPRDSIGKPIIIWHWFLPESFTKKIITEVLLSLSASLLSNASSFLHGRSPDSHPVPVYAVASSCCNLKSSHIEDAPFEITYWLFFPFSQGKEICTISAGAFGPVPFPWLRKACLGKVKRYGDHLGDWEHVTLSFPVSYSLEIL